MKYYMQCNKVQISTIEDKNTKINIHVSNDIGVFVYVCRNIGMNMNIKENIIRNMNIDLSIFVFYCANLYFIALHIILHLTPLHFISLYCNNRRCGRWDGVSVILFSFFPTLRRGRHGKYGTYTLVLVRAYVTTSNTVTHLRRHEHEMTWYFWIIWPNATLLWYNIIYHWHGTIWHGVT